jgi:hypothetical protein
MLDVPVHVTHPDSSWSSFISGLGRCSWIRSTDAVTMTGWRCRGSWCSDDGGGGAVAFPAPVASAFSPFAPALFLDGATGTVGEGEDEDEVVDGDGGDGTTWKKAMFPASASRSSMSLPNRICPQGLRYASRRYASPLNGYVTLTRLSAGGLGRLANEASIARLLDAAAALLARRRALHSCWTIGFLNSPASSSGLSSGSSAGNAGGSDEEDGGGGDEEEDEDSARRRIGSPRAAAEFRRGSRALGARLRDAQAATLPAPMAAGERGGRAPGRGRGATAAARADDDGVLRRAAAAAPEKDELPHEPRRNAAAAAMLCVDGEEEEEE